MSETLDTPSRIEDDLPTLRSELAGWWEDHLKPLIDFRTFLRQRNAILRNRELARSSQPPYDGWKNPFAFALNATTLTFTAVALIGIGFHTLFPDPDLKHDWIARSLQTRLDAANVTLRNANANEKTSAELLAQRLAADIGDHRSGLTVPHEGVILTAGVPLVVYFLGVLFPRFVKRRAPGAPYASAAREIVYYHFIARTFWPGFFLATGGAIYFALMKYSLLNTYDELPQTFPVTTGPLFVLLGTIAFIGAGLLIYAVVATPVAFHKCAKELSGILGITGQPRLERAVYWGLMRSIAGASILAFTLTLLLAAGYTVADSAMDSVRTTVGAALSTAPSPHGK